MDFKTETLGDVTVITLQTDLLDANNAKAFKTGIAPVLNQSRNVVFDMTPVSFLDSSGCGAILSCLRQLHDNGGDLKMYGLQNPVRTLFELIRMHRIIELFNTREEALKSF